MTTAEPVPARLPDGSIRARTHFALDNGTTSSGGISVIAPDDLQWPAWDEYLRAIGQ